MAPKANSNTPTKRLVANINPDRTLKGPRGAVADGREEAAAVTPEVPPPSLIVISYQT